MLHTPLTSRRRIRDLVTKQCRLQSPQREPSTKFPSQRMTTSCMVSDCRSCCLFCAHIPIHSALKRTDLLKLVERQQNRWIPQKYGKYNHSKTAKRTLVAALQDPDCQFTKPAEVNSKVETEHGAEGERLEEEGGSSLHGTNKHPNHESGSLQLQVRRGSSRSGADKLLTNFEDGAQVQPGPTTLLPISLLVEDLRTSPLEKYVLKLTVPAQLGFPPEDSGGFIFITARDVVHELFYSTKSKACHGKFLVPTNESVLWLTFNVGSVTVGYPSPDHPGYIEYFYSGSTNIPKDDMPKCDPAVLKVGPSNTVRICISGVSSFDGCAFEC